LRRSLMLKSLNFSHDLPQVSSRTSHAFVEFVSAEWFTALH
jgi:hypothetical protein